MGCFFMYFFFLYSESKLKIYHRSYSNYAQNASADPCIVQDTCHMHTSYMAPFSYAHDKTNSTFRSVRIASQF